MPQPAELYFNQHYEIITMGNNKVIVQNDFLKSKTAGNIDVVASSILLLL